jgi:hypothetical protein
MVAGWKHRPNHQEVVGISTCFGCTNDAPMPGQLAHMVQSSGQVSYEGVNLSNAEEWIQNAEEHTESLDAPLKTFHLLHVNS